MHVDVMPMKRSTARAREGNTSCQTLGSSLHYPELPARPNPEVMAWKVEAILVRMRPLSPLHASLKATAAADAATPACCRPWHRQPHVPAAWEKRLSGDEPRSCVKMQTVWPRVRMQSSPRLALVRQQCRPGNTQRCCMHLPSPGGHRDALAQPWGAPPWGLGL